MLIKDVGVFTPKISLRVSIIRIRVTVTCIFTPGVSIFSVDLHITSVLVSGICEWWGALMVYVICTWWGSLMVCVLFHRVNFIFVSLCMTLGRIARYWLFCNQQMLTISSKMHELYSLTLEFFFIIFFYQNFFYLNIFGPKVYQSIFLDQRICLFK